MSTHSCTVMAFDYGAKRIGVAVGEGLIQSTRPLETIATTNGKPDWAVLTRLIDTWAPTMLIVGLPLRADGAEYALTLAARHFGAQLAERYRLPVHTIDERLSSHAARQLMAERGYNSRRQRADVDQVAAQIILQTWFAEASPAPNF